MPERDLTAVEAVIPPAPALPEPWNAACVSAQQLLAELRCARRAAGEFVGQTVIEPAWVPQPAVEKQTPLEFALGHLAVVAIRVDATDPQTQRLREAVPHLARYRAVANRGPVAVGPISAAPSAGGGVLQLCRTLTHVLGVNFGGGRLLEAVLAAFPRDASADPWDVHLAIAASRLTADLAVKLAGAASPLTPALTQPVAQECLSEHSEFLRRLFSWGLAERLVDVQLEPLCRWLWDTLATLDGETIQTEVAFEFFGASQTTEREPRLVINPVTRTVTLDGTPFPQLKQSAVDLLVALAAAVPKRVTEKDLRANGCLTRVDRIINDDLPPVLAELISRGRGYRGYKLLLPAKIEEISVCRSSSV